MQRWMNSRFYQHPNSIPNSQYHLPPTPNFKKSTLRIHATAPGNKKFDQQRERLILAV